MPEEVVKTPEAAPATEVAKEDAKEGADKATDKAKMGKVRLAKI
jgi:hypothetical protein